MKRLLLFTLSVLILNVVSANGETKTVEFDFSTNKYGFEVTTEDEENPIKNTTLTEGDASIALGTFYTGTNYYPLWKDYEAALCYDYYSYIVFSLSNGSSFKSLSYVYANSNNAGGENYFYKERGDATAMTPFAYDEESNTCTLTVTETECSSLIWFCKVKSRTDIKKIIITYETVGIVTGVTDVENEAVRIIGEQGGIRIVGSPESVEIFGINGVLLSKGKNSFSCPKGLYIVKANGKAQKVLVR